MRKFLNVFWKILKWVLIVLAGLIALLVLAYLVYHATYYRSELRQIRKEMNAIEGVKVVDIWGHHDLTLEEISADIGIAGKGELILNDLSKDVFNYPKRVVLSQVGDYSFTWYSFNGGVGHSIDIGTGSTVLSELIGVQFNTAEDVVNHYDRIYHVIDSLKHYPELNHFVTDNYEYYLLIKDEKARHEDPIYVLANAKDEFEYASTLDWELENSYYNQNE